jgi:hypothetical protein
LDFNLDESHRLGTPDGVKAQLILEPHRALDDERQALRLWPRADLFPQ